MKISTAMTMRHGEMIAGDELSPEEMAELERYYYETLTPRAARRAFISACNYASLLKQLRSEVSH